MTSPEWLEYRKFILAELERHGNDIRGLCASHDEAVEEIRDTLTEIRVQIERLRANVRFHTKVWAFVAGLVPTILIIIVEYLKR